MATGAKVIQRFSSEIFKAKTSLLSITCLITTASELIDVASLPAVGSVNANQGISKPFAKRGK